MWKNSLLSINFVGSHTCRFEGKQIIFWALHTRWLTHGIVFKSLFKVKFGVIKCPILICDTQSAIENGRDLTAASNVSFQLTILFSGNMYISRGDCVSQEIFFSLKSCALVSFYLWWNLWIFFWMFLINLVSFYLVNGLVLNIMEWCELYANCFATIWNVWSNFSFKFHLIFSHYFFFIFVIFFPSKKTKRLEFCK